MQQQEMLTAWNDLQSRVEFSIQLQNKTLDQKNLSEMSRLKGRLHRSPILDLVIASITAITLGNFFASNLKDLVAAPITALPAVLVFALAIFFINISIRQIMLSSDLDYAKPITEAQTTLAQLRCLRVRSTQWAFIGGFSAWFIFPIVLAQMLIGSNVLLSIHPGWLLSNIAFGLLMIPVIGWIMKKSRYARSLQDEFAGKDIVEAESFLNEIQAFRQN
jgi:hypothetical protein